MYRSWTFILFSVAAVLFLLQVLPMPGIYLMIFGAAFWTGLLLTAGLIAMGVEAHLRRIPRFLILVPIVVFGGYYGVAIWQRVEMFLVERQLQAENPSHAVMFDPAVHDLVVDDAASFVRSSAIAAAFARASTSQPEGFVKTHAVENGSCAALKDAVARQPGRRVQVSQNIPRHSGEEMPCFVAMPARPERQVIEIIDQPAAPVTWPGGIAISEHRMSLNAQAIATYRTGRTRLLSLFPKAYVGCALISSKPAWECGATLLRVGYQLDVAPGGIDRAHYPHVANILLGIPVRQDGAGPFADGAILLASVEEDGKKYADLVFDDLFATMDEADYMPPAHSDKILDRYPERLHGHGAELARAYASLLKVAIGNNNARPDGFAQRRGLLLRALSMLPYDEFRTAAPDLVDAVVAWRHDPIYVRAAMPDAAYKDLYFTAFRDSWAKRKQSHYQELEAIALCRIGNLPADIVDTIRSRYMEAGVDPEGVRQAYFLLLLKAGARKAAVAGLPPPGEPARQWHDRILAGEGNGLLGPNNCLPESRVITSELKLPGSAADLQPVLTD